MRSGAGIRIGRGAGFLALVVLAVAATASPTARADDEAWKARVEAQVARVEEGVHAIDTEKAAGGTLVERVKAVDARLGALEKDLGLVPGKVSGKDDLSSLTQDATSLASRLKKVALLYATPGKPPPDKPKPPPPAPPPPAPKPKPAEQWPETLAFDINAKVISSETGQWHRVYDWEYDVWRSQFLMDGYAAAISFTLAAKNLPREVKSATLRIAVQPEGPLAVSDKPYRVWDLEWRAQNALGNGAFKSWERYGSFDVRGPVRWIAAPTTSSVRVRAEAHVVSLMTKDGREVRFQVPDHVR